MPLECALKYDNTGIVGSNPKGGVRADTTALIELNHEIHVPVDVQSGRSRGKRVHGAVDMVLELDKAAVPLIDACVRGQNLESLSVDWYRPNVETGAEEVYLTTLYENAKIQAVETIVPNTKEAKKANLSHLLRIAVMYERITWTAPADSMEASDSWTEK